MRDLKRGESNESNRQKSEGSEPRTPHTRFSDDALAHAESVGTSNKKATLQRMNSRHKMLMQGACSDRISAGDEIAMEEMKSMKSMRSTKSGQYSSLEKEEEASYKSIGDASVVRDDPSRSCCGDQREALGEILCSHVHVLLIFVPVGLLARHAGYSSAVIFGSNFIALVPLGSLSSASAEAIVNHTGQLTGGLLCTFLGNAVEMVACIQAVQAGLIRVVQGILVGSILSNLLLVLGMAMSASGIVRPTSSFNAKGVSSNMSCLLVACCSVGLPTIFKMFGGNTMVEVLAVSRICSLFLIAAYLLFLLFMLKTHSSMLQDEDDLRDPDIAVLCLPLGLVLLVGSLVLVILCSHALVGSIKEFSIEYRVSKAFIGVIMLPLVGNAVEHSSAVQYAYKGLMDLALGVAVGSATQIALFVIPVAILFGWVVDQPMNLAFRDFDTLCMLLAVFLVSQVLQHGNTNWLHGAMLITVYLFIAVQTCYIREEE